MRAMRLLAAGCAAAVGWNPLTATLFADDLLVSTNAQLSAALQNAGPGDAILIAPGDYQGGLFRNGITGVTIRSQDAQNPAVIRGGNTNLQLSNAVDVTIEDLGFQDAALNGLNIDDGGDFGSPSTNITLRNISVIGAGSTGNHDGIKLSGVTGFLIDGVRVLDWGNGGSAIDMVGSHRGLIQNSELIDAGLTPNGSGIRPKGGSKDITIRANRLEIPADGGRAIQAGGATGLPFFRFIDGDSGYEADEIVAEGNVVIGGTSAFSWVNIDGGLFHRNYVQRPGSWTMRILNENQGGPFVDTRNGEFRDNVVVFNDTPSEYNRAVNIGAETEPETFGFSGNQWYNLADPTPGGSTPSLPAPETGGVYGVDPGIDPGIDPDDAIAWSFPWGEWIVNASDQTNPWDPVGGDYLLASAGPDAQLDLLAASPLVGDWSLAPLPPGPLSLEPFSQAVLIAVPDEADADGDGDTDISDLLRWQQGFGIGSGATPSDGDFDGDQDVDSIDLALWQAVAANAPPAATAVRSVPEPAAVFLAGLCAAAAVLRRP